MARKSTNDIMGEFLGGKGAPSAKSVPGAPSAKGATSAPYIKRGIEIRKEHHEKLRALAYWERRRIRDVIDEALTAYLADKNPDPLPDEKA